MNKEDRRGIILGILGILILLIAIVGASYAYFTARAESKENVLRVKAAETEIVYVDGKELNVKGLIPGSENVIMATISRAKNSSTYKECYDDNNYPVCGAYEFEITNNGSSSVNISASVEPSSLKDEEKEFTHLRFALYDITSDEVTGTKIYTGSVSYNSFSILDNYSINGNTTKKFRLVLWLDEVMEDNNVDQGAVFRGSISIKDKR